MACQTTPAPVVPVNWEFIGDTPGTQRACLPVEDVQVIAERLKRCQQAAKSN